MMLIELKVLCYTNTVKMDWTPLNQNGNSTKYGEVEMKSSTLSYQVQSEGWKMTGLFLQRSNLLFSYLFIFI